MRDPALNTWTFYEPQPGAVDVLLPTADVLSDPDVEDLLPSGLALWPRGAAWGTPDGEASSTTSVLAQFTRALLAGFADLYRRAFELTLEGRALSFSQTLAEWERDYGLPLPCAPGDQSYEGRRASLLAKVQSTGTITPQDFIQLARRAGYEVAIEERFMLRCGFSRLGGEHTLGHFGQEAYWVVHVRNVTTEYFRVGASRVGRDPLFFVPAGEALQCLFVDVAPGWTMPVFDFSGLGVPDYRSWPDDVWPDAEWGGGS